MYPEILGIPEFFFGLVSHITRLGNERDCLLHGSPASDGRPRTMRDFLLRAKLLDEHVCRWVPPSGPYHFMFRAMQKALLIFFYRRVYDVDVTTLQHSVQQVRDLLTQSQAQYIESGQRVIYPVWPAFVTACEALSPDLQEHFQTWFEQGFQQSGAGFTSNGWEDCTVCLGQSGAGEGEGRALARDNAGEETGAGVYVELARFQHALVHTCRCPEYQLIYVATHSSSSGGCRRIPAAGKSDPPGPTAGPWVTGKRVTGCGCGVCVCAEFDGKHISYYILLYYTIPYSCRNVQFYLLQSWQLDYRRLYRQQ